jgi:1-acyl-sn-glycerol-3-phosphate acyltransferase
MSFYEHFIKTASPLIKLYHRLDVYGEEHVPPPGEPFIIAANHSGWFGWDAIVIGSALPGHKINWVAWSYKKEHPSWDAMVEAFGSILVSRDIEFPYDKAKNEILARGGAVGFFPEGNSNPMGKWYRLRPFLPGFARLAAMAGVPIVPCAVAGLEEASPILWAKEEEKEPIKTAVALPVVFPTKTIIEFGKPVRLDFGKSASPDKEKLYAAAGEIQLEVLSLLRKHRPRAYAETFPSGGKQ